MAENRIQTNVAGSIRHVIRTAHFVGEDSLTWKWVVMALHSARHSACVCHLTTTAAPEGPVTERNAGEWLAYFETRAPIQRRTGPNPFDWASRFAYSHEKTSYGRDRKASRAHHRG